MSSELAVLVRGKASHARHRARKAEVVVDVLHAAEPLLLGVGPPLGVQPLGQALVQVVPGGAEARLP